MNEKSDYCDMCKELGKNVDCHICEDRQPYLWLENETAFALWTHVQTQWRFCSYGAGMGASVPIPCGLDYTAVERVAAMLDIEMTAGLLYRIQALEVYTLDNIRKEMADNGKE